MPNVSGLKPASTLLARHGTFTYGTRCSVVVDDAGATLYNPAGVGIATLKAGVPKAALAKIDGDTISAVNAFLRDYGKVKLNWRTKVYGWHPASGAAPTYPKRPTTPVEVATVPVASPSVPVAATTGTPKAPSVPVPGEVLPRTGAKVKPLTKTYSQVGAVLTTHQNLRALESGWTKRQAGKPAGVIITGPAGTAKTRLAAEFAATKGVPFLKVDGSSIQTANDWYGQFVPAAGGFEWAWTPFALALRRGEPMVILVDEINRVENERALNGLMGLQDWTGTFTPVGAPSEVSLPAGILIVATLNEGVEYVGTVEVDAAVRDRFGLGVRMEYPPENVEVRILLQEAPGLDREVAKRLVRVAASQRGKRHDDTLYPSGNVISTRVLISVAEDITLCGAAPAEALWTAVRGRFIPEDEPALNVLIEAQFGAAPVDASTLADDDDLEMMLAAE